MMLERSLGGATARFLDGDAVRSSLESRAQALRRTDPNVAAVFLFGSLARGNYGPESDADLLVVELVSSAPRQMDRPLRYMDTFAGLVVPVDIVVLTVAEISRMRADGRLFIREAVDQGIHLTGSGDACRAMPSQEGVLNREL